jgi:hypothetical protein
MENTEEWLFVIQLLLSECVNTSDIYGIMEIKYGENNRRRRKVYEWEKELVFETSAFDPTLTRLIARENFITFMRRGSFKSYMLINSCEFNFYSFPLLYFWRN